MFLNEWETYSDRYNDDGTDREDLDAAGCDHERLAETNPGEACDHCGETL